MSNQNLQTTDNIDENQQGAEESQTTQEAVEAKPTEKKKTEGGMLRQKLEEALALNRKYAEKEKKRQEEEAKKKGDYETLLKQKEEELAQARMETRSVKTAQKLSKALNDQGLNPEFQDLILESAISKVSFDEDNKAQNIDQIVSELVAKHPTAFIKAKPSGAKPITNPGLNSNRLSMADYKKLDFAARQQAKKNGTAPLGMI